MRLTIAARQSDLARLQAQSVARELKKAHPHLEIEFQFRASLGDLNQTDPLWKMPEKGVFTEDFLNDLISGTVDLVVHSWKDLPTEARNETEIVATLPRADARDLFLFRKDRLATVTQTGLLRILTSSPRRAHNLQSFFHTHLPVSVHSLQFENVRGNIPTRLKKLLDQDVEGLIVAKAALDRLLSAESEEYAPVQKEIRQILAACLFMVMPLSINPTAAAQGALAIEINQKRADLKSLLTAIHCSETFQTVEKERAILKSYGGGCHQKIGINVLKRSFGEITCLRGITDQGEALNRFALRAAAPPPAQSEKNIFPNQHDDSQFFEREDLAVEQMKAPYFWVARETAVPASWKISPESLVWCSGLQTWRKLAGRGIWVNGSSEGLGESESPRLEILVQKSQIPWVKLTHDGGAQSPGMTILATYHLKPRANPPHLEGKTHFFWMSGSSFDRALHLYPHIREGFHASGPGLTNEHLRQRLGPHAQIQVFLSLEDWRAQVLTAPSSQAKSI